MSRNWQSAKGADISFNWADKNAGDTVEGHYFNVEHGKGEKGNSSIYTLKQENKENVTFWGSAVLDDQFSKIAMGSYVRVTYNGKVKSKSGSSQYHSFLVEFDPTDILDMSAGDPGEQPQEAPASQPQHPAPPKAVEEEDDLPF